MSLYSYSAADPGINQVVGQGYKVRNLAGLVGAYAAGILVDFFGVSAAFWPLLCLYLALSVVIVRLGMAWWRWLGIGLLVVCAMVLAEHPTFAQTLAYGDVSGGGFLGRLLAAWSTFLLRPVGSALLWGFLVLLGAQLTTGVVWGSLFKRLRIRLADFWHKHRERAERRSLRREEKARDKARKRAAKKNKAEAGGPAPEEPAATEQTEDENLDLRSILGGGKPEDKSDIPPKSPRTAEAAKTSGSRASRQHNAPARTTDAGDRPSLDLLRVGPEGGSRVDMSALEEMSERLVACLADFGVRGEVQSIRPGPVVTMFEFKPAPGVKISRIAGLSDDLALAMKALAVRIDAIPGQDVVGVEIPNENRETVYLRDVFVADAFAKSKSRLTIALGKNIQGEPVAADLARMPHLLVAGATGAGKSVCLNAILLSFLYKASPDEVKLLLVDPKRIELAVYADLPHLVHPVVTDMAMAKSALDWAVHEMDRRYQAMALLGVRNIDGYNAKLPKADLEAKPELAELEPMPYLVLVIDELADLMMTAGKEAEMAIVRLAQLARAAGIHLILATQRPSVDVVTGLIKANFPSRISFQVTSKHDSRTILDMVGAERLLGRGDSLFKPSSGKLRRVHGAFVDEDEIAEVVTFWKNSRPQRFDVDFADWQQEQDGPPEGEPGGLDDDPVYQEAVDFVVEQGKASISLIQRRFRIGFNRAARYIEQMEADGMLGPQEGSKPRAVLRGRD